jgi:hypothetical protein
MRTSWEFRAVLWRCATISSGSFPVVGLNHERLKHARDLMAGIMDTAQPDRKGSESPPS